MNRITGIYQFILKILAWILFITSWVGIISAFTGFIDAIHEYGLLSINTLLDARLGYYGLFSFGVAGCALILASNTALKSNRGVRLFLITFLVTVIFLLPVVLSILVFLYSQI